MAIGANRPVIKKGERYRQEHVQASNFDKAMKNDSYGFRCLHMSVSESIDLCRVAIINKHKTGGSIGVRTREDTATAGEDFIAIN